MRITTLVLALLAMSAPAGAVSQPDGTPIPQTMQLQDLFTSRMESINALSDAALDPQTFVPGCTLDFTLVTRGPATFRNSFGWYNVTASVPAESDLHVLIPCDAPTGFVATLDLRNNADYRGGSIGFFLRTPEDAASGMCANGDCCGRPGATGHTYYTERQFNPDNIGAGSYIHLLTYDSRATANAFYFAWEDLFGGGDNQFTDFVALVDNIACTGGGADCDTGQLGACAAGTMQCRAGALVCGPIVTPSMERCDGIDNDCDGMVDEDPAPDAGPTLCGVARVCERGACVTWCVESGCFPGFTCTPQGTCIEEACRSTSCGAGERCEGGACVGVCSGVVCPHGNVCRAGRCVDPCENVTCDSDQACVAGVCEPRCECRGCAAGSSCGSDGLCIETSCMGSNCGAGTYCVGGACRDACENAQCPRGEACTAGSCVASTSSDAGVDAGDARVVVDSGASDVQMAPDVVVSDVAVGDVSSVDATVGDAGIGDAGADGGLVRRRSSCGCRTPARSGGAWIALIAVALTGLRGARRRRRHLVREKRD